MVSLQNFSKVLFFCCCSFVLSVLWFFFCNSLFSVSLGKKGGMKNTILIKLACLIDCLLFLCLDSCLISLLEEDSQPEEEMGEESENAKAEWLGVGFSLLIVLVRVSLLLYVYVSSEIVSTGRRKEEQQRKRISLFFAKGLSIARWFVLWSLIFFFIFIAYGAPLSSSPFPLSPSTSSFSSSTLRPSKSPILRTTLFAMTLGSSCSLLSPFSPPNTPIHQMHHSLLHFFPQTKEVPILSQESEILEKYIRFLSLGGIFGAWLGAIVIPLDWDRSWQVWPVSSLYSSAFFSLLFGLFSLIGFQKRKSHAF